MLDETHGGQLHGLFVGQFDMKISPSQKVAFAGYLRFATQNADECKIHVHQQAQSLSTCICNVFLPGPFSSVDAFANPAGLLTQTNSKTSHLLVDLSGEEVMQGTRFGMYTLNILVKGESESCQSSSSGPCDGLRNCKMACCCLKNLKRIGLVCSEILLALGD